MFVIDRKRLAPDGMPGPELLGTLLRQHAQARVRLDEIGDIFARRHRISSRRRLTGLPNNRLAHDLPGYIATMAAGYLVGSPVRYAAPQGQEDAFEPILRAYAEASVESVDAELAMDAAVYGKAVELCYADTFARPRVAQMDPKSCFVVYDDTVEHAPLFGVACRDLLDDQLRRRGERISVYGPHAVIHFERAGSETPREIGRQAHYFGGVPMVEYWNNAREQGDFEPVMGLIDAYDALQSDRVNDKQQFTDAVFVLKGVGALGIYAMKPFKKNPAVLFLLSAGITGVVEYIIGWIAIRCFGMRLWDYRGLFGNISGIICVRSVVSFALLGLGLVFHYLIEPSTERVMGRLSRRAVYGGCSLLAVLLLTDCILSALYRTPITY